MADYYKILGVERNATQAEIKRAYRKKARELHPDEAGGGSPEEFKEVNKAYEVLSNEEKRQLYDIGGEDALSGNGFGGGGFGGFQDIFDNFFGGGNTRRGPVSRMRRGQNAVVSLSLTLEEVVFGVEKELKHDAVIECTRCHGHMAEPGTDPVPCTNCDGTGATQRLTQSIFGQVMAQTTCGHCMGYGTVIVTPCGECAGEGRVRASQTIAINVPAGVASGMQIKLAGKGDAGIAGGPPGDFIAEVKVAPDPVFTREGDDLLCTLEIPMTSAALGTKVTIETFDGEQEIELEPGTQAGHVQRLEGLGVGRLRRPGRGDLKVHLQVTTPTKLDSRQRELLEEFANIRGEGTGSLVQTSSSVFSRIKERFTGR
ncbi:molecular chaperone DnaJ [Trueperella bonasi]|uniref:Chaperone protein DnaJ n=1 Tax=Trueperella bonasi TaxID=312286 RepID=A0ABT9NDZ1_9ACTO|nr:molecular chaperone DnaJ [Trueperella bonasi]MDP9805613.1 molecular chaperone DnaJ [Trueperella bonasi]